MPDLSILLVPGSYCLPSLYQPILDGVSRRGYDIRALHMPTVGPSSRMGRDERAPSMYKDAEFVAGAVEKLADQGKDVILVGHSYAGVPMTECTKGLSKGERRARGKAGGIVHLAYIAALVPAVGQSAFALLDTTSDETRATLSVDENGWMRLDHLPAFAKIICQDIPADEAIKALESLARHSSQSFMDNLTHAGYKDIPSSYLLCENDLAGPPAFQRGMISQVEQSAGGRKVEVTSIFTSHFPNLAKPNEVIDWIVKVADKSSSD